ncbi:MAG: tRNA 2-thiocytidine biosynthesis protein TtcA [Simkaniaceae bacterium]|nr:tRNA 2-thiocytidine biosynthesis protein TtcA [Simkaniaceae bacterium]MCF7852506.1 tRNA 2-thiocytidine biosynthesis protein TtcA [Simkaniaceae bacterium]
MLTKSTAPIIPIATPPWTKLGKKLESLTRKAIYDFDLFEGHTKIAVALSGGKDSLTLLYLLKALSERGFDKLDITAIHVAGEYSCGSSLSLQFLKPICEELGVDLVVCESTQTLETLECYSCSRERRSLLFQAAKERNITHIAFGHHREDSIETLLLNLLHKAEFAANLAKVEMIHYGITIIRPLIYIAEDDILAFAKQYGFNRITCQCPVGQTSRRKDVKKLIQLLEKTFPNARSNLARAAHVYGSDKAKTP